MLQGNLDLYFFLKCGGAFVVKKVRARARAYIARPWGGGQIFLYTLAPLYRGNIFLYTPPQGTDAYECQPNREPSKDTPPKEADAHKCQPIREPVCSAEL